MTRIDSPCLERSLADKAYDFLGDILLQAETEELLMEIEQEKSSGDTAEMDTFFARQDQHNLQQIQRYFRKQGYKRLFTKTLPKVAQIAAVFFAVIALAGSVAIATSHTVRVHVMKLLYEMEEEYTTIKMVEDEEASFDVPAEWQGTSYMSYVPESYSVCNILSHGNNHIVEYSDNVTGEVVLAFAEHGKNIETNVDTEDATSQIISINGYNGLLFSKGATHSVFWSDESQYYYLTLSNATVYELISIANSVKRIN
ncbi:MAG: DUF4367 domain-containing protein [Clostridia bacterium]|nr:DUF4367 domain-containing protein [Clostridia bacterium]